MVDLVDNKEDVVKNIQTFAGYRTGSANEKDFHDSRFRNRVHFIACKYNDSYLFSPIDSAVCKNYPYLQRKGIRIPYNRIAELLGKPYKHGSLGRPEIYAAYMDYCDIHDCNRHKNTRNKYERARCFWLIDSDDLRSQRPENNEHQQPSDAETLLQDIEYINSDKTIDTTTRLTLVNARIGQGKFRDDVMKQWGGACAFSGCKTLEALRASHIKPWRNCSNEQRLDPANGLMLVANLDALFDRHFISFDDNGQILVSSRLSKDEQKILGVRDGSLLRKPDKKQCSYLEHHRNKMSDKQG